MLMAELGHYYVSCRSRIYRWIVVVVDVVATTTTGCFIMRLRSHLACY